MLRKIQLNGNTLALMDGKITFIRGFHAVKMPTLLEAVLREGSPCQHGKMFSTKQKTKQKQTNKRLNGPINYME